LLIRMFYGIINGRMKEKRPQHPISRKERSEYGAVPLEPWTAVEEEGGLLRKKRQTYLAASVLRINGRIDAAMDTAVNQYGWVGSPDLSRELRSLVESSLYDSQRRRLDLNPGALQRGSVDEEDVRYEKAKNGTATPAELLALLMEYPKLESLELAKLSHPLDFQATQEMDDEVMYSLAWMGFDFLDEPGRYKTKSYKAELPAATVLRKQTIAERQTESGTLQVVQRRAFLVRGDEEARADNDIYLDRMLHDPEGHARIYEKIEGWYPYAKRLPVEYERSRKWLQPLATSYYAKYIDEPSAVEKSLK